MRAETGRGSAESTRKGGPRAFRDRRRAIALHPPSNQQGRTSSTDVRSGGDTGTVRAGYLIDSTVWEVVSSAGVDKGKLLRKRTFLISGWFSSYAARGWNSTSAVTEGRVWAQSTKTLNTTAGIIAGERCPAQLAGRCGSLPGQGGYHAVK